MPKNTCGTWPTRSLDAAQPRERSGPHTPARSSNRGRVKLSSARSRCCRPSRRNQGKHAVFPSGPWTTLPPTPPACAIPSSALKVCTLAVASPRPPAKPLSAPVPNALACAGLLSALMLSCLCVPPFSTEPTTRSGSKNMPPDCLQRIHTHAQEEVRVKVLCRVVYLSTRKGCHYAGIGRIVQSASVVAPLAGARLNLKRRMDQRG